MTPCVFGGQLYVCSVSSLAVSSVSDLQVGAFLNDKILPCSVISSR